MNTTADNGLIMQWTEVPDARGGSRLEARWVVREAVVAVAAVTPVPVAAHAA